MTEPTPPDTDGDLAFDEATIATLEALEEALDALRAHDELIPEWEFCEGFMTAMLCTRRPPPQDEWLPALLGGTPADANDSAPFASAGERTRFLMHWLAREAQLRAALDADVEDLNDARALQPATADWRGMLNTLPPEERSASAGAGAAPAYARVWALGFLAATEVWADDWAPPRDKEIAADLADALDCIVALTQDDTASPAFNLFDEQAAPSVSEARMEALGEAIWAVYDLFDIARSLGPRIAPVHSDKIGRNDPCPCGSGKKYKKCCGA